MNCFEVVIRDGNRTVNWIFQETNTIEDILSRWEREYYPCNREKVSIDGKAIMREHLDCQINYFKHFGKRIHIRVETIFPEKEDKEEKEDD